MPLTLADAESHLSAWMEADLAVAKGQSYSIAGRALTRADAAEIRENIDYWNRQTTMLANGARAGARVRYGVVDR